MYDVKIDEESLKVKIWQDIFQDSKLDKFIEYRTLGNIDFCISYYDSMLLGSVNFFWAEAKCYRNTQYDKDIIKPIIQLILTIGKEQRYNSSLPPFIGAFDNSQIVFIEYHNIAHVFSQNDFNWNVRPSEYHTKEFKQLYDMLKELIESSKVAFNYEKDSKILKEFIESNFKIDNAKLNKIQINKNNFIYVYLRWREVVMPTIEINWEIEKPLILESDFFLADVLSKNNNTQEITQNLRILLQNDLYKIKIDKERGKFLQFGQVNFKDNQNEHKRFWNLYERPPKEQYWDYMIERRDLLVPQDIRETKGAFFTPQVWVRKAHEYLEKTFGEDYQRKYYIWDLAAGTGNLLVGLQYKYRIYASTLDSADVSVMHERIQKGANLLPAHVFQFDFLNDALFDTPCLKHKDRLDSNCKKCKIAKLPQSLQKILKDENERKKLIILINPPYAEATTMATLRRTKKHKGEVARDNEVYEIYKNSMGRAVNELFAQFFFRIYNEIKDCILASFSTMKYVNSPNFVKFRDTFKAKFLKGFMCPAFTFDNVSGKFPIGFLIWRLGGDNEIKSVKLDVYDSNDELINEKKFYNYKNKNYISQWISKYYDKKNKTLGYLILSGTDIRRKQQIYIASYPTKNSIKKHMNTRITYANIKIMAVFFAVRQCIKSTWIICNDQFLEPKRTWKKDTRFHNDCLTFMLFSSQNKISSLIDINHFIPFSESEINTKERFDSNFLYEFLQGKINPNFMESKDGKMIKADSIFEDFIPSVPLHFSPEAMAVFNAGRKVYMYYHAQDFSNLTFHINDGYNRTYNANASLYDIKAHFQGFSISHKDSNVLQDFSGKKDTTTLRMNISQKAPDTHYQALINELNITLDELSKSIESKIYDYEFLTQ